MLKFIVEETLAGRAAHLKATTIAMAVFDRGPDFDQQSDPVVRLEARKLRRDLDNYYAGAGRDDSVRISIPKGHYRPKFAPTSGDAVEDPAKPETAPADRGPPPTRRCQSLLRKPSVALVGLFSFFVLCASLTAAVVVSRTDTGSPDVAGAKILVEGFQTRRDEQFASWIAAGRSQEIAAALVKFPDLKVHHLPAQAPDGSGPARPDLRLPQTEFAVTGDV
jgi:hypothetical protein